LLELLGPVRLALERCDLLLQILEDVVDPLKVQAGVLDLALGLGLTGLELHNAGDFFDDDAAFFGLLRDHTADRALFDDRVGLGTHARIHEELLDIAQAARCLIDQILGLAVTIVTTGDLDLERVLELGGKLGIFLGITFQDEGDFGHVHGGSIPGTREDDVRHRTAAKVLGRHVPHDPIKGVASTTFDFPQPFDPTIAVMDWSKVTIVRSLNDLNPNNSSLRIFTANGSLP